MDGETQSDTLQLVLFPKPHSAASLYLHCSGEALVSDDAVSLTKAARVSTNAYFNCFYTGYWRRFADVGKVGVRLTFSGRVRFAVRACCDRYGDRDVASRVAVAEGGAFTEITLWVEDTRDHISEGRLYADVEALAPSEICAIAYVTDTPPLREISLSVGICTYNREVHLQALLCELVAEADRNAALRRVCVVNQGSAFACDNLKDLFQDERLHLIEQANLGGCGGFNRTMHETLAAEPACTHHLLMDDDVRIDARMLDTVAAFLRYAERDIVLGGHMLQTDAETVLLEAGAVFDPLWFVVPVGKGTDLSEPANLSAFDRYRAVDYNGWWFCVLPVAQMKTAGFSPPVFIRCDDMEYGCRMLKQGAATVPLPGVAVWHDLNFSHASDWDQYYDIRNRLILSTLHGDMTPQPGAHFVLGYIVECLLTHRYGAARMCMSGIRDFLLGPDRMFAVDPAERHRQVMQHAAIMPQTKLDRSEAEALEPGAIVARPQSVAASVSVYLRRMIAVLFLPYETRATKLYRYEDINPMTVRSAAYVVSDARRTVFVTHTPRRGLAWSLLGGAMLLAARFMITRRRVNAAWTRGVGVHQSASAWKRLFALRRES